MRRLASLIAALLLAGGIAPGYAQNVPPGRSDIAIDATLRAGPPARPALDDSCRPSAPQGGGPGFSPIVPVQSLAQGNCPAGYPLACGGTNDCCPANTPYLCRNLNCRHPDGTVPVGWSGCVGPRTQESFRFWSSCCALWIRCG